MLRRSFPATLAVIAGCAAVPVVLLGLFGKVMFMPPMWVHFYGVGVTALVAMAAAVFLMVAGARQKTRARWSSQAASRSWRRCSPFTGS